MLVDELCSWMSYAHEFAVLVDELCSWMINARSCVVDMLVERAVLVDEQETHS